MTPQVLEAMAKAECESCGYSWAEAPQNQKYWIDRVKAALTAAREAGFVMVPLECTPDMKHAGSKMVREDRSKSDIAMDVYDAMLATARGGTGS